jgi:hypothetical protein
VVAVGIEEHIDTLLPHEGPRDAQVHLRSYTKLFLRSVGVVVGNGARVAKLDEAALAIALLLLLLSGGLRRRVGHVAEVQLDPIGDLGRGGVGRGAGLT